MATNVYYGYMNFEENVSLKDYSTMKLGGNARFICSVSTDNELVEALEFAAKKDLKTKVIGDGSNIVWPDSGYDGLVIVNNIEHIEIDGNIVKIGAGVNWDKAVEKTVQAGLSGLEFLSLIPGKTGAVPVQNVGAYGREISDVLIELRAYDKERSEIRTLRNEECEFGYRSSIFNQKESGRYVITEITLELKRQSSSPPFYRALQEYLDANGINDFSPNTLRHAVIEIRKSKLPDPKINPNNGSFFANPIISKERYSSLKTEYPDIPGWEMDNEMKIPAAWLISQAGFADYHDKDTGMGTWPKHPLVVVNESAEKTEDLVKFTSKIIDAVNEMFGIKLRREPEIVS